MTLDFPSPAESREVRVAADEPEAVEQNKISNSYSQFGLRGRAPRGVTGELSPASVYVSLLPVVKTKSRLIEIHGFLPFSARRCALVPIPVHPHDLSRPLRGPYESRRPMRGVRALGGANPYGGVRPRPHAHIHARSPPGTAGVFN